jgi:hypothetical protein
MLSNRNQTMILDKSQKDALQQYLMDPHNSVDFDENFNYDDADYTNLNYEALVFESGSMALYSDGLRDAFESIDAKKATQQAEINICNTSPTANGSLQYGLSVCETPAIGLHDRDITMENSQARLEPTSAHINSDILATPNVLIAPVPMAGLIFANRVQAQQAFSRREVPYNWQPPQKDITIPQEEADRKTYIAQLMEAFTDTSQCQDPDGVPSLQEQWTGVAQGHSLYTSDQMETVCWKLLEIAMNLHHWGPGSLHIYDQSKFKLIHKSRKLKFAERIELLCDLMRLSKARCVTFLDFDDLEMTVGSPAQVISMTKTNKKQNRKRQELILEGRAQLKTKEDVAVHNVEASKQSAHIVDGADLFGFINLPDSRLTFHQQTLGPTLSTAAVNQLIGPMNTYTPQPKQGVKRRLGDSDNEDDDEAFQYSNKRRH